MNMVCRRVQRLSVKFFDRSIDRSINQSIKLSTYIAHDPKVYDLRRLKLTLRLFTMFKIFLTNYDCIYNDKRYIE